MYVLHRPIQNPDSRCQQDTAATREGKQVFKIPIPGFSQIHPQIRVLALRRSSDPDLISLSRDDAPALAARHHPPTTPPSTAHRIAAARWGGCRTIRPRRITAPQRTLSDRFLG